MHYDAKRAYSIEEACMRHQTTPDNDHLRHLKTVSMNGTLYMSKETLSLHDTSTIACGGVWFASPNYSEWPQSQKNVWRRREITHEDVASAAKRLSKPNSMADQKCLIWSKAKERIGDIKGWLQPCWQLRGVGGGIKSTGRRGSGHQDGPAKI